MDGKEAFSAVRLASVSREKEISVLALLALMSGSMSVMSLTEHFVFLPADAFLVLMACYFRIYANAALRAIVLSGVAYIIYILIVSHFVHNSEALSIIKYAGLQGVNLSAIVGCFVLTKRGASGIFTLTVGLAIGYAFQGLLFGIPQRNYELGWEGGLSLASTYLVVSSGVIAHWCMRRGTLQRVVFLIAYLLVIALISYAAVSEKDRSTAMLSIISAMIMVVSNFSNARWKMRVAKRPLVAGIVALIVVAVMVWAQVLLAVAGLLPADTSQKSLDQWNHSRGYVVGARADSVSSFVVAWHNPLLGIGTSSRDSEMIRLYADLVADQSVSTLDPHFERAAGYVPLHSTMGGAWARVGLPGLIVWVVVVGYLWRGTLIAVARGLSHSMSTATATAFTIYGILFEPAVDRFLLGIAMAGALHATARIPAQANERAKGLGGNVGGTIRRPLFQRQHRAT